MSTICFYAQFTASKIGVNSLTVTWDIERITRSALVTGGANGITIGRRGLYGYVLTSADLILYDYVATAITATSTVDAMEVTALWTLWSLSWHDIATSIMSIAGSLGKMLVDSVDSIASRITTDHGAGSYVSLAAGAGIIAYTYIVTSSVDSAPIPDVTVLVYSDAGMTVLVASGITDAFGQKVFYLDPGTYYFFSKKSGYNFTNPDIEIIS